jgi:hypothetical protein
MKVGDLVKYDTRTQKWAVGLELVGLVVETGLLGADRKDVKILWNGGETTIQKSSRLEVINESR